MEATLAQWRVPVDVPKNSEEVITSQVGNLLFNKFYKNYTRKQWGCDPKDLSASVCGRIPIRSNRDDRYLAETFQALPKHGYHKMFERMVMRTIIRKLRWIVLSAVGVFLVYICVYVLLSLFGQYRPMTEAELSHWEIYPMWAPLGSFDSHPPAGSQDAKRGGAWRGWIFHGYCWLWGADNRFVHTRHDVHITGYRGEDGKWTYTTNSLSPLAVVR
jgi:hypothetical protein